MQLAQAHDYIKTSFIYRFVYLLIQVIEVFLNSYSNWKDGYFRLRKI